MCKKVKTGHLPLRPPCLNRQVGDRATSVEKSAGNYIWIIERIFRKIFETRSSWLNCALRDDEAVYWVSIGHYEAVAVGN